MATVAELERLKALVTQLIPLTGVQRGELIRAQDWNAVVSALIEVARAAITAEAAATVAPHEHPDQVAPGWLQPGLRSLIERGPLADPPAVARIADVERRLDQLRGQSEQGGTDLKDVRDRITDIATRELALVNDVTMVRRKMDGLADARDDVLQLRQSVAAMQKDVQTALEVGKKLTVDGQPVDMQAVADRLKTLETLRARLTLPSGELLDAAGLEQRLTELTNTLVTQAQLDDALKTRPGHVPPEEIESIRTGVRTDVLTQVQQLNERLAAQIRDETAARLSEVDAHIARAVGDAIPSVRDDALAAIRPEIAAAAQAAQEAARVLMESRLADAQTALRAELGARIDDVQRGVGPAIQAELDLRLPPLITGLQQGIDNLGQRLETIEPRLAAHDEAVSGLAARIEAVAQQDAAARTDLQQAITRDLDARLANLNTTLDERFQAADAATGTRIDTAVAAARDGIISDARQAAAADTTVQLQATATQLRAEMHQAARDELAGLEDRIPGMIAEQVKGAMDGVLSRIFEQLHSAIAEQVGPLIDNAIARQVPALVAEQLKRAFADPEVARILFVAMRALIDEEIKRVTAGAAPPGGGVTPGGFTLGGLAPGVFTPP